MGSTKANVTNLSPDGKLTLDDLIAFLGTVEWYDNSRIETIQACKRKAFYQLIGPTGTGLAKRVGDGAHFGTCTHAAHEAYYTGWSRLSETARRLNSIRAFTDQYQELFPNGPQRPIHTLANGLDIWDCYCDSCLAEDSLYRPVDPELGLIVRIAPRSHEPAFKPFWYLGRADGVWQRIAQNDYFVGELKTSSGGVERRAKSLTFHRQPTGYVWQVRELVKEGRFPEVASPLDIKGSFVTVIGIQAQKRDLEREYFSMSEEDTEDWRAETIQIVEEWRRRKWQIDPGRLHNARNWKHIFYKETEECTKYGLCPYWDLCKFGVTADSLHEFEVDDWNPLIGSRQMPKKVELGDEEGTIRLSR